MSRSSEKFFTNDMSGLYSPEDAFASPDYKTLHERDSNESDVFYDHDTSTYYQNLKEPQQIKIQKAPEVSYEENENLILNQKLLALYNFFNEHPLISLNNFHLAEKLFAQYFDEPTKFINRILKLNECLPKAFAQHHRFGHLKIESCYKGNFIKIKIQRSKLPDTEQSISIFLEKQNPSSMLVFSKWNWKNKKYQVIRSTDISNRRYKVLKSSIEFDAKVWQAYNPSGIHRKHFIKTLDCIERNYKNLGSLINSINRKSLLNLFDKTLISNASIKTDNQDNYILNFRTNSSQKVDIRVTKFATSLTAEH
jgi:hypothetical protein